MIENIYIGGYSNHIHIGKFQDGRLELVDKIGNVEKPSYLHVNQDILYTVSETKEGSIASFKILNEGLQKINSKEIKQSLPCHITTNEERNQLLVANYGSGSVLMYEIQKNGAIGKKIKQKQYPDSHMHFAEFIGNTIYAVDLGNDAIYLYDTKMELLSRISIEKESGPRHLVTMEKQETIYIVTEMSNQVLVYQKQGEKIQLVQQLSTLGNSQVASFAGAIKISNNNKNIYVTNRGENSISVFAIHNHKLKMIQNIPSYGDFPRDIFLNQTEEYAIVANQKSNNLVIFKRDLKNGTLTKMEDADVYIESPSCIVRSNYEV